MFAKVKSFLSPPVFADDELTRRARILNIVLTASIAGIAIFLLVGAPPDKVGTIVGLFIFMVVLYIALHRGYVQLTGSVFVIGLWAVISLLIIQGNGLRDSGVLAYFIAIVMASLLAGRWMALLLTGLVIVTGWGFVYAESLGLIPNTLPPSINLATDYSFSFAMGGVLAYLMVDGLQKAVARVEESNRSLEELSQQLEERVEESTHELAVAAEVGRRVSRVQDLDKLLVESVELIRQRFDLYHVQIYLADAAEQYLNLRASTGGVGHQLLNRGYKLPIRWGSINGSAAVDKKPVLVTDTSINPLFHPNPLLPFTRSEVAMPLLVSGQLLGVLDLQSEEVGAFSSENLSLYRSLADQLAVAVNNAYLLRQAERAQRQMERYVNLVTRQGQERLAADAEQKGRIGVRYDLNDLEEYDGPLVAGAGDQVLQVPITVANIRIGTIRLEAGEAQEWGEEAEALVTAVAQQVGRQADNLRLLDQMARYRAEAELATRRLSGEAWRDYLERAHDEVKGFSYKENSIVPLTVDDSAEAIEAATVKRPLKINNETIGEFLVSGVNQDGAKDLIDTVITQLGNHMENLRLAEQTDAALAQTEILYQIGHSMNGAKDVNDILHAALDPVFPTGIDEATLMFIELDRQGEPKTLELLAGWRTDGPPSFPVGTIFPMQRFPFTRLFMNDPDVPQLIEDTANDERVDDFTRQVMAQAGIKAIVVVPLTMAGQWVGVITCSWPEPREFTAQEEAIFNALINLAAPAVQSQRLFYKTKNQADREHLIHVINERIQSADTIESALQTAVKELGQALQSTTQIKLGTLKENIRVNHQQAENGSARSTNGSG